MRRVKAGLWGAVAAAVLIALGAPLTGSPRQAEPIGQRIDSLFERFNRPDSPGCSVAVARGGETIHARGYGMANLEYDVKITPDTIFEAGSVSKQFTSAAINLLALDGKLSLDDPARKYLPELPEFASGITIRHLLTHTGGLRSQWPLLTLAGRPPGEAVHSVAEILDLVNRQTRPNFAPGEDYLYNNTAFTLLGVVVQRASGKSFQAFCDERLFKPIGMTSTAWREDHRTIVKNRATAYRAGQGGFGTYMSITNVIGNGGLLTTVGDLTKWNQNLDDPKVGGKALVESMHTRGVLNDGFVNEYAQGLIVTEYRGLAEVSHGGSTAGYQTYLARYPSERVSVAVLCNVTNANPAQLAHNVADVVLESRLAPRPEPLKGIEVPAQEVEALAGLYRETSTDAVLRVTADKGRLRVGSGELVALGPGRFGAPTGAVEYVFEKSANGGPTRLTEKRRATKPRQLVSVPAATPTGEKLNEYVGTYWSDELEVIYRVGADGKVLALRHRPESPIRLAPLYEDAFQASGNIVRFTRDKSGKVDGLEINAGRSLHVRFVRRPAGS